mmetsp:Transcript_3234/g.1921  ORF Transcript_3234/g.1921 Transcript_3234/m.1921 type:complete len:197 (-) Transcript_3234:1901-2491(-)
MLKKIYILASILLITYAYTARAVEPIEKLKNSFDRCATEIKNLSNNDENAKKKQRKILWQIVNELFDFIEISKRTLGRNWNLFNPYEKKEFVEVFKKFLGNTYIDKIQSEYKNEYFIYLGQEKIKEKKAVVKTKLVRKDAEIYLNYNMIKQDNSWKIYDIQVEGLSLVKNYRSQFEKILFKRSPVQLIEKIKKEAY